MHLAVGSVSQARRRQLCLNWADPQHAFAFSSDLSCYVIGRAANASKFWEDFVKIHLKTNFRIGCEIPNQDYFDTKEICLSFLDKGLLGVAR